MDTVLFKYHGHGGDYLVYDGLINQGRLDAKTVRAICARNFGLGASGVLAGFPTKGEETEVMLYRPDGSQADVGAREEEIFNSYLRDAGYLSSSGQSCVRQQDGDQETRAVGKLFLSEEFVRRNHLCGREGGRRNRSL